MVSNKDMGGRKETSKESNVHKEKNTQGGRVSKAKVAKKKARRRRRAIIIGVEVALLIVLAGFCYVVNMMGLLNHENVDSKDIYIPSYESGVEEVLDGYRNIAVIGVDTRKEGAEGEDGELSGDKNGDVLMIISINNKTKDIKLVSLFRDTYLKLADSKKTGKKYEKANFQMQIGDATDTMNMMNMNMDLDIKEYVTVNWGAVARAIDILGGVDDVKISQEMLDVGQLNGYITSVVNNTGIAGVQISEPGTYTLTGVQAVAYCRTRYVGYDYGRTERQREVIQKMLVKAKEHWDLLPELIRTVFPNVSTNISMMNMLSLATDVAEYNIADQTGFPFEKYTSEDPDGGYVGDIPIKDPVVVVDLEKNVAELHQFLFGVENYKASDKVKEISDYIKKVSGVE